MWKQLLDFVWQALHLAEDTERNQQSIEELEKTQRDFATSMEQQIYEQRRAIERLAAALERLSEREETERRILKLELENQLLRQERGLPPAKQSIAAEPETSKTSDGEQN
jgi:hypothetical protein